MGTRPKFELIGITKRGIDPMTRAMAFLLINRVCAEATAEETEAWLRENHPAGTSGNWRLSTESHRKPVTCSDDPKRTHYMFVC